MKKFFAWLANIDTFKTACLFGCVASAALIAAIIFTPEPKPRCHERLVRITDLARDCAYGSVLTSTAKSEIWICKCPGGTK